MRIRYRFIENVVLEKYRSLPKHLLQFPLDIKKIIELTENCTLWTYQHFSILHNISIEEVIFLADSKSGSVSYNPDTNHHLILYNNSIEDYNVPGRQNFTLCHELGHVELKHLVGINLAKAAESNDYFKNSPSSKTIREKEADYFSSTFLAPLPLFKLLKIQSPIDIQHTFGFSVMASQYKFKDYLKWKAGHIKTSWENDIINLFKN